MANLDFNNTWPYCEMKEVTVDGQKMVRIPKIYVCNTKVEKGTYKGKQQYSIAKEKVNENFHVHPAFMNNGVECSALDLSCFEASHDAKDSSKAASVSTSSFWEGIKRDDAINACKKRNIANGNADQTGWHCWDVYCQHLLARLMLIEKGTTNFGFNESGSPEYVYRGIHQPAGHPLHPTWLPGIGNLNGKMHVYGANGNSTFVNTNLAGNNKGWPTRFSVLKGNNFDLGDIFLADAFTGSESGGACGDYQYIINENVTEETYFTGYRGQFNDTPANSHGMFAFAVHKVKGGHNGVPTSCTKAGSRDKEDRKSVV